MSSKERKWWWVTQVQSVCFKFKTFYLEKVDCVTSSRSPLLFFLSTAENKPIWMHAEEREEMSKVRTLNAQPHVIPYRKKTCKTLTNKRSV